MQHSFWFGLFFIGTVLFGNPTYADDSIKHTDNTSVQLFHNGKNEVLAKFSIQPNWHISWSNPGDAGQPTVIRAENSEVEITAQSVPTERTLLDIMHEYIYENTAYYALNLTNLSDAELTFDFVECNDVCKPETLSFELANISPTPEDEWRILQAEATQTFPQKITLTSPIDDSYLFMNIPYSTALHFAPTQKDIIDETSIEIETADKGIRIRWQNNENEPLRQALLITPKQAYLIDIEYKETFFYSLLYMILLAFFGGIILNAMPCVFPVLSLKIFTLLRQSRKNFSPFKNAILYICGVYLSFMILSVLLVLLKQGGFAIGWGFQLQSPWFVGIMAGVFFILFFCMIEWFHFPHLITQRMHKLAGLNEFATGFFAVLIASPCTGPFMGAAIGYAFMRSNPEIFAVFTALALGYALPYALIELYPQMLYAIMPKPGKWMRKLQLILAVPLLLTAIWLSSVLYTQLTTGDTQQTNRLDWKPYNAAQIEQLNANGENVFVDFTADWCLTCKFNHKIILDTDRFANFVHTYNVHLFVADMTEYNPEYSTALKSYGRDSIPLYVYYHGGNHELLPLFFRINSLPH